jgi:MFS family permease
VIYIIANIALGVQNSYAALLVLRCLQSTGISGTVALSTAAIADVVTSAERGTYIGWASVGVPSDLPSAPSSVAY